jgi:glycosyltransferase involved in cell wall biosynthesis
MDAPIRVLQLTTSLTVGGAERLLYGLVRNADEQRVAMHIMSARAVGGDLLRTDFEALGLPLEVIGARRTYEPRVVAAVARYARANRIDIIHTHLTDADFIGGVVGRLLGIPVISTMHNMPHDYDRQRFDRRILGRLAARLLITRMVAVSHRIRGAFITQWGIPEHRITAILNAIALDPYTNIPPKDPHAATDSPMITTIGRLTEQKAQQFLLEAAVLILARFPTARFVLVGQGHLEPRLRELARARGIEAHVEFTGVRRDIPNILAETDIFVLSSLWEGMPLTAIEAMAAGRAVVLSDVGGMREVVGDLDDLLVPPGDIPALAAAISRLLEDPTLRVDFGQRARERVCTTFQLATMVSQYTALYESLARCNSRAIRGSMRIDEVQDLAQPE